MAPQRNSAQDVERETVRQFLKSNSFADCVGQMTALSSGSKQTACQPTSEFVDLSAKDRKLSFKSDDYGLWDDGEADENLDVVDMLGDMLGDSVHSLHSTSSTATHASVKTSSSVSSLRLDAAADDTVDTGVNPVFVFENGRAPVCCRAFESPLSSRIVQVSISLPGFRIVQSSSGEYAEFRVKMLVNGKEMAIWKKFHYFEQLADACREYSSVAVVQSWASMFTSTSTISTAAPTRKCRRNQRKIDFRETLCAWEKVLVARFWGWTLSHTISVQRLMEESQLLEQFLKCILFEVPSHDILMEFFSQ